MLVRRLVAGPSQALLARHRVSLAVAESAKQASSRTAATAAASSSTTTTTPPPPRRPSPAYVRPRHSPKFKELVKLISNSEDTNDYDATWAAYSSLTGRERNALSMKQMSRILRSVVPRHQAFWDLQHSVPKRSHLSTLTFSIAQDWERRLRTVVSDMLSRGENDVWTSDWFFVLQILSNMGLIGSCEAIVREMPEHLKTSTRTNEYRLQAVLRWSRFVYDSGKPARRSQIDEAYEVFWATFNIMKRKNLYNYTIRLLLQATAELALVVGTTKHQNSFDRLHKLTDYILQEAYALQLDNIPMSAYNIANNDTQTYPLSARGLEAVMQHLVLRKTDPYRILASFEVLSVKESAQSFNSRFEEEDDGDDDILSLSAMTAAEEASPSRRDWLGRKVNKEAPAPDGPEPLDPAVDQSVEQGNRSRLDYLPSFPPVRTILADVKPSTALPPRVSYNTETIVLLLNTFRALDNRVLFFHVLETAVHDAQASQAAWLSSYLGCPPEERQRLKQPLRISPEWFRIALAYTNANYRRWSTRVAALAETARAWVEGMSEVIVETEQSRGTPRRDSMSDASVKDSGDERIRFATPDFAIDPSYNRVLRHNDVFIISSSLDALYRDRDELVSLSEAAQVRRDWRNRPTLELRRQEADVL